MRMVLVDERRWDFSLRTTVRCNYFTTYFMIITSRKGECGGRNTVFIHLFNQAMNLLATLQIISNYIA